MERDEGLFSRRWKTSPLQSDTHKLRCLVTTGRLAHFDQDGLDDRRHNPVIWMFRPSAQETAYRFADSGDSTRAPCGRSAGPNTPMILPSLVSECLTFLQAHVSDRSSCVTSPRSLQRPQPSSRETRGVRSLRPVWPGHAGGAARCRPELRREAPISLQRTGPDVLSWDGEDVEGDVVDGNA